MTRYARQIRLTVAVLWSLTTAAAGLLPVYAAGGLPAIDAFHVGRHHLANGDREAALSSFNDALRLNPQFVQAYVARGKLLAEMGQHTAALADLNFALHLQPTHTEGFAYRGFALLSLDRPEEALADFNHALRLDPSYARVYYLRGQALQALGDTAGAETGRATALRLDPTIEIVQTASAAIDGATNNHAVVLAGPTLPQRTSIMSSSDVPMAARDRKREGNVIRYDQHPVLAKLVSPSISQPLHREPAPGTTRPRPPAPALSTAARPLPKHLEAVPLTPLPSPTETQPSVEEQPTTEEKATSTEEKTSTEAATSKETTSTLPTLPVEVTSEVLTAPAVAETVAPAAVPLVIPTVTPIVAAEAEPVPVPEVAPIPVPDVAPIMTAEVAPIPVPEVAPVAVPTVMPDVPTEIVVAESTPPVVVAVNSAIVADDSPAASAILAGNLPAVFQAKPTAEASAERMTAALESAKQAVVQREAVAYASDMPTTESIVPVVEMPSNIDPIAMPVPPAVAETALVASSPLANSAESGVAPIENVSAELDDAVRQTPGDAALRCRRGEHRLDQGQYAAAAADFDEALKIDPALLDALYGRARAKYLAGRPAEALEDYAAVLRFDEQHADALIERGHCFAQLGRNAEAEQDRNAALALNPSLTKTGPKYDVVVMVTDEAATDAELPVVVSDEQPAALQAVPQAIGTLFQAAPVVTAAAPTAKQEAATGVVFIGDAAVAPSSTALASAVAESPLDVAVRELSNELIKTPGDARLYVLRAQALLALGRAEDAVDDLTIALRIEPSAEKTLQLRSRAYEALGRMPEAQADRRRATETQPAVR